MRRNMVLPKIVLAFATAVAISAASGATGAAAGGGGASHRLSHRGGAVGHSAVGHSGATSRIGGPGALAGAGYAGTLRRFDAGGHESGGWYQRGWGGTLDTGWGYGFGPSLGGSSR